MKRATDKPSPRSNQTLTSAWDSQIRLRNAMKYPKWCAALQAGNRFPNTARPRIRSWPRPAKRRSDTEQRWSDEKEFLPDRCRSLMPAYALQHQQLALRRFRTQSPKKQAPLRNRHRNRCKTGQLQTDLPPPLRTQPSLDGRNFGSPRMTVPASRRRLDLLIPLIPLIPRPDQPVYRADINNPSRVEELPQCPVQAPLPVRQPSRC
jgi:hypothetical protein